MTNMKEKVMELMRLSSLFLWLLLSFVALQDNTSLALRVNVMLASNNQDLKQSHQESCTKSKEMKASKTNEEDVVQVNNTVTTTTTCCNRGRGELDLDCELRLAKSSTKKSNEAYHNQALKSAPSTHKMKPKGVVALQPKKVSNAAEECKFCRSCCSLGNLKRSQEQEDELQLFEAAAELLKMLNKDYHQKPAPHLPIHNGLYPLDVHVVKP